MKRRLIGGILAAAALSVGLAVGTGAGQDQPEMSQEEMMAAYAAAAAVGEHHELLGRMAGEWRTTSRAWMDPAAPPQESTGKNVAELIMGGRFLKSDYEGVFMDQPMHGLDLLGYDNVRQEYCGVWLDNMSTFLMPYTGSYDPETKKLTCQGEGIDAATGQEYTARLVTTFVDDNKHVFEFFSPGPDGKEVRWVEITYERQ